jgi:hypothetical protein
MGIIASSTPLQYEYKPLNLEAFAAPLARMQEQLDTTKDTIANAEFDISHLPYGSDPEKAKALQELVASKRDEIAKNLIDSKNYRQANREILKLQKLWKTDPEKLALESNLKTWTERVKEEKERIDKPGGITKQEFEEWQADELRKFGEKGGTSYIRNAENPEGTYNPITGKVGRTQNLDEQLQKLELELGKAVPGQKVEGLLKAAGIDTTTMDKHFISTTIDEKNAADVARRVSQYLQTLPEYKPFFKEKAYYSLQNIKNAGQYDDYSQQLVNGQIAAIDKNIKAREEYLNSPKIKGDKEKDAEYQALLDARSQYEELKNAEKIDPQIVANLHEQQYLKNRYDKTALGNLLAYKNIEHAETFRDIPQPDNGGGGGGGDVDFTKTPFVLPIEYMKFSTPTVQKQISVANGKLHTTVTGINDLGVRNVINRNLTPGSDFSDIFTRQKILRNNLLVSGNPDVLKQNLKKSGITVSTEEANSLWKTFKSPNSASMTKLNQLIEQGNMPYQGVVSGKSNLESVKTATLKDNEVRTVFNEIGTTTPFYKMESTGASEASRGRGSTITNISPKALIGSYTSEKDKQIIKKYNIKPNSDGVLTFDAIAKLNGYSSFHVASIKNPGLFKYIQVDTNNVEKLLGKNAKAETNYYNYLGGNIVPVSELVGNAKMGVGSKGFKSEEMAYNLLNDQKNNKLLASHFSTMNQVMANGVKAGFAGQPGFDDEGNKLPGTDIKVSQYALPKFVFHEGNTYIGVPYTYSQEGKQTSGTLYVVPQPGSNTYISQVVNSHRKQLKNATDPLSKETYATLSNMAFSLTHGNDVNDVMANADIFDVSKAEPTKVLGIISGADSRGNAKPIEVVKKYNGQGVDPTYGIRYTGESEIFGNYGTVSALRAAYMQ